MTRLFVTLLVLGVVLAGPLPVRADAPVGSIGEIHDVLTAIAGAHARIELSAWTLDQRERIIRALQDAAARGVRVQVTLTRLGIRSTVAQNRQVARALSAHGIQFTWIARPIHLKALVVDYGTTVALDDTNWGNDGTILFLPATYASTVEAAIDGKPVDEPPLTFTKGSSQAMEAALLVRAHHDVRVETESFDANNVIARAIQRDVTSGIAVTLIVAAAEFKASSQRAAAERMYLDGLHRHGVTVLIQSGTRKGAVVDGVVAWLGSTNATNGDLTTQLDWGYASADPAFVQSVAQAMTR